MYPSWPPWAWARSRKASGQNLDNGHGPNLWELQREGAGRRLESNCLTGNTCLQWPPTQELLPSEQNKTSQLPVRTKARENTSYCFKGHLTSFGVLLKESPLLEKKRIFPKKKEEKKERGIIQFMMPYWLVGWRQACWWWRMSNGCYLSPCETKMDWPALF